MSTDRGVSEAIGFVLVFALITMTLGVVYASGFAGLQSAQQQEQLVNVERAFDVFSDNLRDIHQERAPSRATEIKLSGGTLSVVDTTEFSFNTSATSVNGLCNNTNPVTLSTRPIAYEFEGSSVVYEAGAIIRTDGNNSAMVSEPSWITGTDQSILPYVSTAPEETAQSVGGDSTVLVVARHQTSSLQCQIDTASTVTGNVTVETTEARSKAWEDFFERQEYTVTRQSATTVTAEFPTKRFFVSRTSISLDIED